MHEKSSHDLTSEIYQKNFTFVTTHDGLYVRMPLALMNTQNDWERSKSIMQLIARRRLIDGL